MQRDYEWLSRIPTPILGIILLATIPILIVWPRPKHTSICVACKGTGVLADTATGGLSLLRGCVR